MLQILVWIAASAVSASFIQIKDQDLYKDHDWFGLKARVAQGAIKDPLLLGATSAAFGEEKLARTYLDIAFKGKSADDAHKWSSYLNMREGHYKAAADDIKAGNGAKDDAISSTFRELPDQFTKSNIPASIPCRILKRKLFLPVKVAGHQVELILDSDANISFVSETAAKNLGLVSIKSSVGMTGALGATTKLKFTSADVVVGKSLIRNVVFTVMPDEAELFKTLRPDQQGGLGLPVLLALNKVSWNKSGRFQIGKGIDPKLPSSALGFDGADPIVQFSHGDQQMSGVFDTGAEETWLWSPFKVRFESLVARDGKVSQKLVKGFGGSGTIPSYVLPKLSFTYGGTGLFLKPATILARTTTSNSQCLAGRMGLDLLRQAKKVTIDFSAMKLQLVR